MTITPAATPVARIIPRCLRLPGRLRHLAAASAVVVALAGLLISPAAADHGLGHNGETMTLSAETDIEDGQVITAELSSWLPGATITVVTCFNFPSTGPWDCELSNYGQHKVTAGEDGTATLEYPVSVIPGRCDHENPCYIVAGDGIGGPANYAGVLITFAEAEGDEAEGEAEAEEPPTTTTQPPTTTTQPPTTTAAPAEPEPAEEPAEPVAAEEPAPETTSDDGGSGGSIAVIAVVVVVLAAGVWIFVRRRSS